MPYMKSCGTENLPLQNAGPRLELNGLLLCPYSIVSQSLILLFFRFADEARTYENIHAQRPTGFDSWLHGNTVSATFHIRLYNFYQPTLAFSTFTQPC